MFKKILIANRGEIAVRIARTCRELDIATVAVYEAADETSLHIRLADECVLLNAPRGFNDQDAILQIARDKGVEAIHPGYGFLAENIEFIERCNEAHIAFIGPPVEVVYHALAKVDTLAWMRQEGLPTVESSGVCRNENDLPGLGAEAEMLGYPVIVKSCRGGRGRGERIIQSAAQLEETVRRAQAEAQAVYGDTHVFIEKAISPAHQIGVQIIGDDFGNLVHLGEREGSMLQGNQKIIEESPAPCLNDAQRAKIWDTALTIARLLKVRGIVTIEFLVDARGEFYFTEIKPRIVTDHPLTEMRTRFDLVREQIRLAAGEALGCTQDEVRLDGCAMSCRVTAQDPQQQFMPSPGRVRVRFPNGPETRVDTYVYSGCLVPGTYDPLIAKLTVWGNTRAACHARLRRALHGLSFSGITTNTSWLEQLAQHPAFVRGDYTTETTLPAQTGTDERTLRDFAIAAALSYARAQDVSHPTTPPRVTGQWHRAARELPE
jgi:acetyl/propionyl-CoA carboxylase alpha subunit